MLDLEKKTPKKDDKSTWVIGGMTLVGIGVGFILLQTSALWFVAAILIGIGLGLAITSIISSKKNTWVIGGTTLMGIGVGFIFLQTSALWFVAAILIGVGLGLAITSIISSKPVNI